MLLRFTKMHGLGNDFVVIDAITQNVRINSALARHLADRHFGIGCDQVLLVEPSDSPELDFKYRIFNADGNEVAQCGNGARCFAKFVRDQQLTNKQLIRVQTASGVLELKVHDKLISVTMGVPGLRSEEVPFVPAGNPQGLDETSQILNIDGIDYSISVLSMGNPHAILVVEDVATAPVGTLGPEIGGHTQFPEGVNVGFMAVRSPTEIDLRVYERGVGETLACGSGACAAVVAGQLQDLLKSPVKVNLGSGHLTIEWTGDGQPVTMTGPATTVFHGRIRYDIKKLK